MTEGDDKIIRPNFGDPKMTVDRLEKYCSHKFITVRPRSRTVLCRMCKQKIDPFDVVLDMASDWDMATWREREMRELGERVEQLKTEEANTKARIRSARKQTEQPTEKIDVFFAEMLRRINAAQNQSEIYAAEGWAKNYNWLSSEQTKTIRDAVFRARQRAEVNGRASTKRRGVRVINGGA